MSTPTSPAVAQPRKSALKNDDDPERSPLSGAVKAVQIAEPEAMSQPVAQSPEDGSGRKQHTAGRTRRLSGRLPATSPRLPATSPRTSFNNAGVEIPNSTASSTASPIQTPDEASRHGSQPQQSHHSHHGHNHHHHHGHRIDRASQKLISQVAEWLQSEKDKKAAKKKKRATGRRKSKSPPSKASGDSASTKPVLSRRPRSGSIDSQSSEVSLDRLQRIVDESMSALGLDPIDVTSGQQRPGRKQSGRFKKSRSSLQLYRAASSDTDYVDGDVLVPSCEAVLDNSKTLSYSGGKPGSASEPMTPVVAGSAPSKREESKHAWLVFKSEIIRLAHTLRLKGWRRVPLESGDQVGVERLSGALTNAVYVVSPPADVVAAAAVEGRKVPPKLLLRIYGPNVEQLIDREKELSVLQRLARKKIGPRLLGTFTNGRFEQYLNATALTPPNLREPETSRMIAKRMRELHDGIDLLEQELGDGPNVWVNWDNWLDTVERTVMFLDHKVIAGGDAAQTGFVCGVEWSVFRGLVDRYRKHLNEYYGQPKKIREKLVFAHNDTQYGNILRVRPDDEKSPLLQPANEHKQLVVIDFEYAAANLPGLEFANHFTEWAYNYHDAVASFACNTAMYPTLEQQRRFVRAYVDHKGGASSSRVTTPVVGPASTPPVMLSALQHSNASSSSIVEFMLDARVPPGGWKEEEKRREEAAEAQVNALLEEARLWRPANSAQWVAWGIVQAKLPDLAEEIAREKKEKEKEEAKTQGDADAQNGTAVASSGATDVASPAAEAAATSASGGEGASVTEAAAAEVASAVAAREEDSGEGDEFDYLAYTRDRALFFLGDCVLMGLVKLEDLPEGLRTQLKLVDY
ncbi:choline kinase [Gaeumannomyces tritici R3-111a-1]|uniref:Choline kinase n=1 Tax=Gaeumannomyces tritici (strain R3-111a-1) TaxID=644352 RepID=J3PA22_GAET3|nr:choline kinase [Gaeumannomyces tritici R3-111a-1]EJT73508.1 choline kinase [Gaeumannomyces tritici R3-111a-1]